MAEPAENNSTNDQKYQEVLGVERKISEILDHGKAGSNKRAVDNTIHYIIEFIT